MLKSIKIDFTHIAVEALSHADFLLSEWLPSGCIRGSEYVVRNPTRDDHKLGSFKINTDTGVWCDFSTGDKGGDLISLYAYLKNAKQSEAAHYIADRLGIRVGVL